MRPSIVVAVVVAIGAATFIAWPSSTPAAAPAVPATTGAPIEPAQPIHVAAAPISTDSAKASSFDPANDPRIATLHSERDLVSYLDQLETEVRARGSSGDALARASAAGTQVRDKVGGQTVAMHLVDFGERLHRMDREREATTTRAQ